MGPATPIHASPGVLALPVLTCTGLARGLLYPQSRGERNLRLLIDTGLHTEGRCGQVLFTHSKHLAAPSLFVYSTVIERHMPQPISTPRPAQQHMFAPDRVDAARNAATPVFPLFSRAAI